MATYQDIYIDQGTSFNSVIPVKSKSGLPVDISGYFARGQFRKHWKSSNAVNFITRIDDPADGRILIGLAPEQTRNIRPGRYWFDIELYDESVVPSRVIRVIEGQVHILPRVTRGPDEIPLPAAEPYEDLLDDGWFYDE